MNALLFAIIATLPQAPPVEMEQAPPVVVACPYGIGNDSQPLVGYYFNASWCVNCKVSDAVVEQLIEAGLNVEIVDIDEQPELARRYNVDAVPKFVLFDGANYRWVKGAISPNRIIDFYGVASLPPADVDAPAPVAASVGFTPSDIPAVEPGARVTHIDGVPVAELLPKAKSQPAKQTRQSFPEGYHYHQCRNCGNEWGHTSGSHSCRNCGVVTTRIARWANR